MNAKGEIDDTKPDLLQNIYKQNEGVDYVEVFSPITRMVTI